MQAPGCVDRARRVLRIRGAVQGVGFRPAVYRLACSLGLVGFVRNDASGVWLEIEGAPEMLDRFAAMLEVAPPPGARIDAIETASIVTCNDASFRIADSALADAVRRRAASIPADLAPCDACLRELADPSDRRYRYPFINCTACGPRFTIVREVPYDRARTTMDAFRMCHACLREHDDPLDRRFHAVPNACPACGPRAQLVVGGRVVREGDAAVRAAAAAVAEGAIVALKGAGGFLLAVDAASEDAVARLRLRKRRPHKPLAVVGRSLDVLDRVASLREADRRLLGSAARPIVLAPAGGTALPPSVAPGLRDIGVGLPATPLQVLLVGDGPPLQVMTSGNLADEPIARTNEDAYERLREVADFFLVHDREVHARVDDSVVRATRHEPIPIRRARGFVPDPIAIPVSADAVLAVGGHERNTVCLAREGSAVLSQHVGHVDHPEGATFFRQAIAHLSELVGVAPVAVAHDAHPDYRSTRWAVESGLPCFPVQHHHAHVAACMAEHGHTDPVIGVAFDGTGLGDDGTLWGGEILEADLGRFYRRGHLRPLRLAGGEAAIRFPWRLALAALVDAGEPLDLLAHVPRRDRTAVRELLPTGLAVASSGAGRWFDAIAALLRIAADPSYDGQPAAELEAAADAGDVPPFPFELTGDAPFQIDLRPMVREVASEIRRGTASAELAARFHATLAHAILAACRRTAGRTVVLTGGCFQNRRLSEHTAALLEADGFRVLQHRRVPPGDGGLSLGQAAVASFRLAGRAG